MQCCICLDYRHECVILHTTPVGVAHVCCDACHDKLLLSSTGASLSCPVCRSALSRGAPPHRYTVRHHPEGVVGYAVLALRNGKYVLMDPQYEAILDGTEAPVSTAAAAVVASDTNVIDVGEVILGALGAALRHVVAEVLPGT